MTTHDPATEVKKITISLLVIVGSMISFSFHMFIPKIPEKEARKFLKDEGNKKAFPKLYFTVQHWIESKETNNPCYTIKWED